MNKSTAMKTKKNCGSSGVANQQVCNMQGKTKKKYRKLMNAGW